MTAGVARETSILNQLKDLNSPPIPESSVHFKGDDLSDYLVFTVKELLLTSFFSLAFSVMKSRLQTVEKELQNEKRRRMDAEATLKDVERECREPFVVPALLEAFITISKITSQAVDLDTTA